MFVQISCVFFDVFACIFYKNVYLLATKCERDMITMGVIVVWW